MLLVPLAPDSKKIFPSFQTVEGKNQLVLIQAEKGNELAAFDVPDNAFIKELTFAGGDTIISIAVADSGIRLLQFNFGNGIWNQ